MKADGKRIKTRPHFRESIAVGFALRGGVDPLVILGLCRRNVALPAVAQEENVSDRRRVKRR